jgi:hypothetical protein
MEVHDTHSHEPVFLFSTIPSKEARCLEAAREPLISSGGRPCHALLPCGQPPACFCWQGVSLSHHTTFRRSTTWIPEVCSVGLAKAYPETDRAGGACMTVRKHFRIGRDRFNTLNPN